MKLFFLALLICISAATMARAERFSILAINVENLFDADEIALFDDYRTPAQGGQYTRRHLLTKLNNITSVLKIFADGIGPDIILFQEIEGDQTPAEWHGDMARFLTDHADTTVEGLLIDNWDGSLAGVPAHVWLYKKMLDSGMRDYFISVAELSPDRTRPMPHVNATFSRFPILAARTHHSPGARGALETKVDIAGYHLYLFNAHWRSGASNPEIEPIRVENARVVRQRLDEIIKNNPQADIIIGGDLNSQYSQAARFPEMTVTGINHILGSQGDELAIRGSSKPDIYNLWFELPEDQRGSSLFRGQWSTLMHIIVSRGLYDYHGVQYVDNSFDRAVIPGKNACAVTRLPVRWTFTGDGGGFSDHFPVYAWFQIAPNREKNRWLDLDNPSRDATGSARALPINYATVDFEAAPDAAEIAAGSTLQGPAYFGRVMRVRGAVTGNSPLRIDVGGEEFQVWSHNSAFHARINQAHRIGETIEFHGALGNYRGAWQFVIHDESWIQLPVAAR